LPSRHRDAPLVHVKLQLPPASDAEMTPKDLLGGLLDATHPQLATSMRQFASQCPELTDRSKRRKRECTNVC